MTERKTRKKALYMGFCVINHEPQHTGGHNIRVTKGTFRFTIMYNLAQHNCIMGVNNWARDFCTKSQFYGSKTGKIDEL